MFNWIKIKLFSIMGTEMVFCDIEILANYIFI